MHIKGAVAIVCFNRATEVQKTLDSLESALFSPTNRVIVCQLGDPNVEKIVNELDKTKFRKIFLPARKDNESTTYLINRNVHTAIKQCFEGDIDYVTILEDDIEIHERFFEYILQMHTEFGRDPRFRAINGFSANSDPEKSKKGYGKYIYGVGWGWSINRKTWNALQEFWSGSEDLHWDGLVEPYIRTGFVVMPNWSLILNNGLSGNGTHTGENKVLADSIKSSFECNKISDSNFWEFNQIEIDWRADCFTFFGPTSFKGALQRLLNSILFKLRDQTESFDFVNKLRRKIRGTIFRMLSSIK